MNALVHILKDYSIVKFYASRDFLYIFMLFMRYLCIFMHSCVSCFKCNSWLPYFLLQKLKS